MNCLWCDEEIIPEMSWTNIVSLSQRKHLCSPCEGELILLQGERCQKCSRISNQNVCADCIKWENHPEWRNTLNSNYSVYAYNKGIQQMISKWKYEGDYILGEVFRDQFTRTFKKNYSFLAKETVIAPIPLSDQRIRERGFNQADVLASFLPMSEKIQLKRKNSEKQAKKTRYERMSSENPFILTKRVNKPVILVDDIYTTGTTLRHAALLLKESGCPSVNAYTLIRG